MYSKNKKKNEIDNQKITDKTFDINFNNSKI